MKAQDYLDEVASEIHNDWLRLFYPEVYNQQLNAQQTVKLWQLHWKNGDFRYQFHAEDFE